jgi:hypothetical protein
MARFSAIYITSFADLSNVADILNVRRPKGKTQDEDLWSPSNLLQEDFITPISSQQAQK